MIERFEDLEVWQVARELLKGVYRATRTRKLAKDYPFVNQMKRAVISISNNIAEGFERGTRKQNIEFCYYSKGSAGELRSMVVTAHDVDLIDDEAYKWLHERCESCSRMIAGYIRSLSESREKFPSVKLAGGKRKNAS